MLPVPQAAVEPAREDVEPARIEERLRRGADVAV